MPPVIERALWAALLAAEPAGSPGLAWLPAAIPVFIAGGWIVTTTVLGLVAGHMTLLARYPPDDEPEDEVFRWASGSMRLVSFGRALHVGLGARGLHLAPGVLFRPIFGRGLPCIPWPEIRMVRAQQGLAGWFRGSLFEIPAAGIRFALHGEAGRAVEQRLSAGAERPRRPLVREG